MYSHTVLYSLFLFFPHLHHTVLFLLFSSPPSPLPLISSLLLGSVLVWLSVIASYAFLPLSIATAGILSYSCTAVGRAGALHLQPSPSYRFASAGSATRNTFLSCCHVSVRWRTGDCTRFHPQPMDTFACNSWSPNEIWIKNSPPGFWLPWKKL